MLSCLPAADGPPLSVVQSGASWELAPARGRSSSPCQRRQCPPRSRSAEAQPAQRLAPLKRIRCPCVDPESPREYGFPAEIGTQRLRKCTFPSTMLADAECCCSEVKHAQTQRAGMATGCLQHKQGSLHLRRCALSSRCDGACRVVLSGRG